MKSDRSIRGEAMRTKIIFIRAIVFLTILICIAAVILSFEQPRTFIRAQLLQAQVDEELPDGTSEIEVANWCLSHGFGIPVRRAEGPGPPMFISTSLAPPSRPGQTTCLAIDFYFDANSKLFRRTAFRCGIGWSP